MPLHKDFIDHGSNFERQSDPYCSGQRNVEFNEWKNSLVSLPLLVDEEEGATGMRRT